MHRRIISRTNCLSISVQWIARALCVYFKQFIACRLRQRVPLLLVICHFVCLLLLSFPSSSSASSLRVTVHYICLVFICVFIQFACLLLFQPLPSYSSSNLLSLISSLSQISQFIFYHLSYPHFYVRQGWDRFPIPRILRQFVYDFKKKSIYHFFMKFNLLYYVLYTVIHRHRSVFRYRILGWEV